MMSTLSSSRREESAEPLSSFSPATTVIRVKRRRDEPAPSKIRIQPLSAVQLAASLHQQQHLGCRSKRARQRENNSSEDALLASLMHQSTYIGSRSTSRRQQNTAQTTNTAPLPDSATNNDRHGKPPINKAGFAPDTVIFRRVTDVATGNKALSTCTGSDSSGTSKRKADVVHVVESRLDATSSSLSGDNFTSFNMKPGNYGDNTNDDDDNNNNGEGENVGNPSRKKRKRIALQLVETRIMTQSELWNMQQLHHDRLLASQAREVAAISFESSANGTKVQRANILRNRIKRSAAISNGSKTTGLLPILQNSDPFGRKKTVLDPLSRLVDSHLLSLHNDSFNENSNVAQCSISSHISLLTLDERIISTTPLQFRALLNWTCTNGSGTILHQAALFQDTAGATQLLLSTSPVTGIELGRLLDFSIVDGENRTAYQIACLIGGVDCGVARVIAAHEGAIEAPVIVHSKANREEREEDYVYDVYYRVDDKDASCRSYESRGDDDEEEDEEKKQDGDMHVEGEDRGEVDVPAAMATIDGANVSSRVNSANNGAIVAERTENDVSQVRDARSPCESTQNSPRRHSDLAMETTASSLEGDDGDDSFHSTVEIRGGIGYWNEHGELVLETQAVGLDANGIMSDDEGNNNDDDDDSNAESCERNDYPDEVESDDDNEDYYEHGRGAAYYRSYNQGYCDVDPNTGGGTFMTANMLSSKMGIASSSDLNTDLRFKSTNYLEDEDSDDDLETRRGSQEFRNIVNHPSFPQRHYQKDYNSANSNLGLDENVYAPNSRVAARRVHDNNPTESGIGYYSDYEYGDDEGEYTGAMHVDSSRWSNEALSDDSLHEAFDPDLDSD